MHSCPRTSALLDLDFSIAGALPIFVQKTTSPLAFRECPSNDCFSTIKQKDIVEPLAEAPEMVHNKLAKLPCVTCSLPVGKMKPRRSLIQPGPSLRPASFSGAFKHRHT